MRARRLRRRPSPAAPARRRSRRLPAQPAAPAARTTPRLSLAVTPGRDRTAPFRFRATGALALPAGTAKAACTPGRVIVRVTSGAKTVAARTADLKANCTFSARLELSRRTRRGALKVTATFAGNAVLSPATSRTRTVRVR